MKIFIKIFIGGKRDVRESIKASGERNHYCEIIFNKRPEQLTDEEKSQLIDDIKSGRFGEILWKAFLYLNEECM